MAEYDDSRPAAEVADEINEIITELHGEKGGKGEEEGPEAPKGKKKVSYKVKPTGWTSSAVEVLAVLVGMTWSGARDSAASTFNGPTLKNPLAQGITRTTAASWTLLDSLNIVYPIAMREAVAFQSNDYYAYQHELGDAGSVPKTYEYLWPEGGLTRALCTLRRVHRRGGGNGHRAAPQHLPLLDYKRCSLLGALCEDHPLKEDVHDD